MSTNQQLPLTLKPSKLKLIVSFLLAIGFTVFGIWLRPIIPGLGALTIGFFGLCIVVFGIQFLPGCAYLEITEDGFTIVNLFQKKPISWADVASFGVRKIPGNNMVVWNYSKDFGESERKLSDKFIGTKASLPDTYGMSAEDLADMLNKFLRQNR